MSALDRSRLPSASGLDDLPTFDLCYLFDDAREPTEVTVFPSAGDHDVATTWITIDVEHAVPLDDVR